MNPTIIRFDVSDVVGTANILRKRNVQVEVRTFEWGTIGVFFDPDYNRCELKQVAGVRGAAKIGIGQRVDVIRSRPA